MAYALVLGTRFWEFESLTRYQRKITQAVDETGFENQRGIKLTESSNLSSSSTNNVIIAQLVEHQFEELGVDSSNLSDDTM